MPPYAIFMLIFSAAILLYAALLAVTKDYKMLPLKVQVSLKRMKKKEREEYVFKLSKAVAAAAAAPAAAGLVGIRSGPGALIAGIAVLVAALWIATKIVK